jgi:hypothetical protein
MKSWEKLKNRWKKFWYLRELKRQKALLKAMIGLGDKIKVEKTPECWHWKLEKIDGFWYQCLNCKRIYMFPVDYGFERADLAKQFSNILSKTKGKK